MATFADDFNRADAGALGNGWTDAYFFPGGGPVDSFTIFTNKARGLRTGSYAHSGAKTPIGDYANWDISVDITLTAGAPAWGVIARATSNGTFYLFYMDKTTCGIYRVVSEVFTQVVGAYQTWNVGTTKTVRFLVKGTSLKGYLNGLLVLDGTDTTITAVGGCGLHANVATGDDLRYDTFSASAEEALDVDGIVPHASDVPKVFFPQYIANELRALSNFNADAAHELLGTVLLDVNIASVASMEGWVENVVKVPHLLRAERNFDVSPAHQGQKDLIALVVDAVISHALRAQVQFDAVISQEGKRYSDWTLESGLGDSWSKEAAPSDTWAKDGAIADGWSKE